jgi:glycosyltransferase involved in cell wall biosynthesis
METNQPLRVLHVVESFGAGVLEVVRNLTNELVRGGDAVAVAHGLRPESPTDRRQGFDDGVEVIELPWARRTPKVEVAAGRALRSLAKSWRPDVVHLHSSFAGAVGSVAVAGSYPSIYTPHGYSFTMRDQSRSRRAVYRLMETFTARRVDLVGAVSEAEAEVARLVAPADKVVVVNNGIPALDSSNGEAPPCRSEKATPPRAVAVGRIDAARQPAATAGILARVADVAEVAWVGGGGRGGIPESVVTERGVPVSGWLAHDAALELIGAATACLHWTAWDGAPLSVLEAMACDTVVIASDIPATREILTAEQICATEEEAAAKLRQVLTQPDVRRDLLAGQRARRAKFGADRMASEWRKIYERVSGLEPAWN